MRFRAEHHLGGSVGAVTALLVDPAFHSGLRLPDLELLDIVDSAPDGDEARLGVRYRFVGRLDPLAKRLLGGRELTWRQDLRLDRATGTGRLTFHADAAPNQLHGGADMTLAADGDGSVRRLAGELVVSVPLVGGTAERRIVPGLLRRLDIEAEALNDRLRVGDQGNR